VGCFGLWRYERDRTRQLLAEKGAVAIFEIYCNVVIEHQLSEQTPSAEARQSKNFPSLMIDSDDV
jgi:hypothetical protein